MYPRTQIQSRPQSHLALIAKRCAGEKVDTNFEKNSDEKNSSLVFCIYSNNSQK